jgi:2-polyprenyl-3-methyl-5-hydroxy-6-metoxy-1,4-benzoquinol methylase
MRTAAYKSEKGVAPMDRLSVRTATRRQMEAELRPFWRRNWLLRKARWIRYPREWRGLMWQKAKDCYRSVTRNGIFFEESELFMCSLRPEKILEKTLEMFAPKSVVDLGCGVGRSLDFFHEHGIDVLGIEGSELAISRARHK